MLSKQEYLARYGYVPFELQDEGDKVGEFVAGGRHERAIKELERRQSDISAEVRLLYDAVLRLKPWVCLEGGVRGGESTMAILTALDKLGEGELWSCDIDDARVPKWVSECHRWTFEKMPLAEMALAWRGPKFKFIFVDTSHKYDETYEELGAVLPLLEDGGESYWHDVNPPWRVGEAINDWLKSHPGWEVSPVGNGVAGMAVIRKEMK